jgi:hypothetical protein
MPYWPVIFVHTVLPTNHFVTHAITFCFLFFSVRSVKAYSQINQQFRTVHRSLLDMLNVTFRVRAAHGASVLLLSTPGNIQAPSYQVDIGAQDNTKTIIRVKSATGETTVEQDTKDILSIIELRPFWISWTNGTLKFGTGSIVDASTVISVADPQPAYRRDVHSLAVSSESATIAEWEFGDIYDAGTPTFSNSHIGVDGLLFATFPDAVKNGRTY